MLTCCCLVKSSENTLHSVSNAKSHPGILICFTDVDECSFLNGGCEDICTNSFGSFSCGCSGNGTLNADGKSCTGRFTINFSPLNFCKPFSKRQILDTSKLKGFADDNFKFDESCRKLSKPVESTVGKEEIARHEQFLLFPQCFQKTFPNKPWFLLVCCASLLKTLWEKEKLLVTSNFSFSHSVFCPIENFLSFSSNLKLSSANSFSLERSKICRLGKS